jgi:uncharacterized protein
MKIKVGNILEEGTDFRFSQEGNKFLELLPDNEAVGFSLHRVAVICFAKKVRSTVSLQVNLDTSVDLDCSRCLEPVTYPIKAAFAYTLVPEESGIGEEDLSISDEDLNVGYYREDLIELDALVLEQIILQIPIKPLCQEDCKGLCAHCGANLNAAACGCGTDVVDRRFAALKNFKGAK